MFKLDIQFASNFIPQKKINTVHMINFGSFPKYDKNKTYFSVFSGQGKLCS